MPQYISGQWKISYAWESGSISGKFGQRTLENDGTQPFKTDTYSYDLKTQVYTDKPDDNLRMYRYQTSLVDAPYSASGDYAYADGRNYATGTESSTKANGQMKVTYEWVPTSSSALAGDPPERLSFWIRGNAKGSAENLIQQDLGSVTTRDRAGENGSASVGLAGGGGKKNPNNTYASQWEATGTQLFTYQTQGKTKFSQTFSMSAEGSIPSGRVDENQPRPYGDRLGRTIAHLGVYSEIDNRYVTLSRSGAPPAKSEKDSSLQKNRDEWIAADGTGHGHTLASYKERILFAPTNILDIGQMVDDNRDVLQTLVASRSGTWSPAANLTYKWSPAGLGANNPNSTIQQMPRSNAINNPEGIGLDSIGRYSTNATEQGWINLPSNKKGQVVKFQYELTDLADNAKAVGKYELTLHDVGEDTKADTRCPSGG